MDDLTAFVTARLDDDERYAHVLKAFAQRQEANPSAVVMETADELMSEQLDMPELFAEAARWKSAVPTDLTRVLREVTAKRAILAYFELCMREESNGTAVAVLEEVVTQLATVWSDHPDYRAERLT